MNYHELLQSGRMELHRAGFPEPEADARELLFAAADLSMTSYAARMREKADPEVEKRYRGMLRRRLAHEPVQYITGEAPFLGRMFAVTPDVLIPRFDTETLVETSLLYLKPGMRVLDLCTGSGCVGISLALEGPGDTQVDASDISEAALRIAEKNARNLSAEVRFFRGNLFEPIRGNYDIIVSNPPYVRSGEIADLDPEVRDFEPRLALDGAADGLAFYRRIVREAPGHLADHGRLLMEIGCDEGAAVAELLEDGGFSRVEIRRDLAGRDRVAVGEMVHT